MRWTPPRKPSNIPGVQNATTQPNQCPQAGSLGLGTSLSNPFKSRSVRKRDVGTSEDCLFLKFVLHLVHMQRLGSSFHKRAPTLKHRGRSEATGCFLDSWRGVRSMYVKMTHVLTLLSYAIGSDNVLPSQNFVRESNYSVITVAVQYRLGLFGKFYPLVPLSPKTLTFFFRILIRTASQTEWRPECRSV